jgi:hypothetical protein
MSSGRPVCTIHNTMRIIMRHGDVLPRAHAQLGNNARVGVLLRPGSASRACDWEGDHLHTRSTNGFIIFAASCRMKRAAAAAQLSPAQCVTTFVL